MTQILKMVAFVVALPLAVAAVVLLTMTGCKRDHVVCDPAHHPPATGAGTGPGTTSAPATTGRAGTMRVVPMGDPVAPAPPIEEMK